VITRFRSTTLDYSSRSIDRRSCRHKSRTMPVPPPEIIARVVVRWCWWLAVPSGCSRMKDGAPDANRGTPPPLRVC